MLNLTLHKLGGLEHWNQTQIRLTSAFADLTFVAFTAVYTLKYGVNLTKVSTQICFFIEGIGMDTCVIPLRHGGLSLVQTTDYIYPIVDDPYMMVKSCGVLHLSELLRFDLDLILLLLFCRGELLVPMF